MTREELNKLIMQACKRTWNEKTCKEIERALSQEQCDDAVNRQAVLDGLRGCICDEWVKTLFATMVKQLPSVNPQPCNDAISRSGAIKAIEERAKRIKNEDTLNGLAGAVGILFELPSVTQKSGEWIPVSEKLPEDMCHVWLTCISKVDDREPWVCEGFYNPYYHGTKYSKWGNIPMLNWDEAEVIAWMEQDIPEPYKAESEEQTE